MAQRDRFFMTTATRVQRLISRLMRRPLVVRSLGVAREAVFSHAGTPTTGGVAPRSTGERPFLPNGFWAMPILPPIYGLGRSAAPYAWVR